MVDAANIVRSLAFGVSISVTSSLIKLRFPNSSFTTPPDTRPTLQPPGWLFGIVWTILYILVGVTWVMTAGPPSTDLMFTTVTVLCCIWLPTYLVAKRYVMSTIILVLCAGVTVAILALTASAYKWLLTPFLGWILFASYLNLHRATAVR